MELQFYGANTIRISTKKASIVIDDNLADLGAKSITKPGEIALFTAAHAAPQAEVKLVIDLPGEYEVSDTSIQAIAARAHIDEAGQQTATMYKIIGEDVRVGVLGHIYPELNDAQLEAFGTVDVLFVPVGGNGFTLDSVGALKIIKKIEPKIVIPTHFADSSLKFPVPQQDLEEVLKSMAMEPRERVPKLKIKAGEMADTTQLVVLEKQ
jgi:L-ascorbate metabolism protein UlaG (beta-lactamase superfamily)